MDDVVDVRVARRPSPKQSKKKYNAKEKLERHRVHLDAPVQVLQGPLRVVHEASRTSKARGVDPFSRNARPFQVTRDGLGPSP